MTLKEVNEIFPLKSGMCLKLIKGDKVTRLALFQYGKGKLCYTDYSKPYSWEFISIISNINYDVIKVYGSPHNGSVIFAEEDKIFDSIDYEVKELTLQEIADKFGVKVENLRIKE